MASTVQPLYANAAGITCTLASLAASSTVGRSSASVDNTTNKYTDAIVRAEFTTGAAALGGNKGVYVYIYASEDGTNFEQEESNQPGTDAAYTINSPTVFRRAAIVPVATSSKVYGVTFSVARVLGFMPKKWGLIIVNDTGTTLAATGNTLEYTGVNPTF